MQDVAVAALAPHRRVRGVIKLEGRSLAGTLGVECAVLCVCLPRRIRGRFAPRGPRDIGPRKVAWCIGCVAMRMDTLITGYRASRRGSFRQGKLGGFGAWAGWRAGVGRGGVEDNCGLLVVNYGHFPPHRPRPGSSSALRAGRRSDGQPMNDVGGRASLNGAVRMGKRRSPRTRFGAAWRDGSALCPGRSSLFSFGRSKSEAPRGGI